MQLKKVKNNDCRVRNMKEAFLKTIMLDIAVTVNTGFAATGIEECQCPRGYKGSSCESCDRGFYQVLGL